MLVFSDWVRENLHMLRGGGIATQFTGYATFVNLSLDRRAKGYRLILPRLRSYLSPHSFFGPSSPLVRRTKPPRCSERICTTISPQFPYETAAVRILLAQCFCNDEIVSGNIHEKAHRATNPDSASIWEISRYVAKSIECNTKA